MAALIRDGELVAATQELPAYEHVEQTLEARRRNRNSYRLSPRGVNLPSGMNMTEEKVGYVCEVPNKFLHIWKSRVLSGIAGVRLVYSQ